MRAPARHRDRQGRVILLLLLGLVAAPAGGELAAQRPEAVRDTPAGAVLDFQDADLKLVLSALAELAGVNITFAALPAATVTLRTSGPVSPEEARRFLESVARANGLDLVTDGGLIRIAGDAPTRGPSGFSVAAPGAAPGGTVRLFVHKLRHAKADDLAGTIAALFGTGAPLSGQWDQTSSLSEQLRRQRNVPILPMDTPPAPSREAQPNAAESSRPDQGASAGLLGPVQIVPDSRTNSLLIRALPADYETIRAAIHALDERPLQVLIEVLIAEVRRSSDLGVGISVEVPDRVDSETGVTLGGSVAGADLGDLTISALGVGGIKADVLLRALAASGEVSILSRPVIIAQNNQQARILVGSERPFIQLFRALPTDAAIRDQVVQYRDVGTQLTIRPTINPDGYVSLLVLQEVSTATTETQFGAPVISTREAETELLVKDGHTAVIGGLLDEQEDETRSGIPVLMDIPLLGGLFRSTVRRSSKSELFLFITPHVLASDADVEEATRELRETPPGLRELIPEPIPLIDLRGARQPPGAASEKPPAGAPAGGSGS